MKRLFIGVTSLSLLLVAATAVIAGKVLEPAAEVLREEAAVQ